MIRSVFLHRYPQKTPQDAQIPVWPLWLIVATACLIAVAIAERLDSGILSVSPFML